MTTATLGSTAPAAIAPRTSSGRTQIILVLLTVAVIAAAVYAWLKARDGVITRDTAKSIAWKLCDELKRTRELDWNGPVAVLERNKPTAFTYSVVDIDVQLSKRVDYPTVATLTLR